MKLQTGEDRLTPVSWSIFRPTPTSRLSWAMVVMRKLSYRHWMLSTVMPSSSIQWLKRRISLPSRWCWSMVVPTTSRSIRPCRPSRLGPHWLYNCQLHSHWGLWFSEQRLCRNDGCSEVRICFLLHTCAVATSIMRRSALPPVRSSRIGRRHYINQGEGIYRGLYQAFLLSTNGNLSRFSNSRSLMFQTVIERQFPTQSSPLK